MMIYHLDCWLCILGNWRPVHTDWRIRSTWGYELMSSHLMSMMSNYEVSSPTGKDWQQLLM